MATPVWQLARASALDLRREGLAQRLARGREWRREGRREWTRPSLGSSCARCQWPRGAFLRRAAASPVTPPVAPWLQPPLPPLPLVVLPMLLVALLVAAVALPMEPPAVVVVPMDLLEYPSKLFFRCECPYDSHQFYFCCCHDLFRLLCRSALFLRDLWPIPPRRVENPISPTISLRRAKLPMSPVMSHAVLCACQLQVWPPPSVLVRLRWRPEATNKHKYLCDQGIQSNKSYVNLLYLKFGVAVSLCGLLCFQRFLGFDRFPAFFFAECLRFLKRRLLNNCKRRNGLKMKRKGCKTIFNDKRITRSNKMIKQ